MFDGSTTPARLQSAYRDIYDPQELTEPGTPIEDIIRFHIAAAITWDARSRGHTHSAGMERGP